MRALLLLMLFALLFITITIDFSCGSTTTIQSNVSSCLENERRALIDFKENLTDEAHRLRSWVGKDCCTWEGVNCSRRTGHVIKLDLPNPFTDAYYDDYYTNELTGEMTPSFVELKHLSYLDLSRNNLSASSVDFLGSLKSLRYLDLSYSNLVGKVPHNLGNLSRLQYLDLNSNYFEGPIPNTLGQLSNLQILDLSYNSLNGSIPVGLGQLSNLQWLDLSDNSLDGNISEQHFTTLKNLKELTLSWNSLVINVGSQWVPPFQLQLLYTASCTLGPQFPQWLQTQRHVTQLDMSDASISDIMPDWFELMSSCIRYLDISNNHIRGKLPKFQTKCNDSGSFFSRELFLSSNKFDGPLSALPPSTYVLDLSNNLFSGPIPAGNYDEMSVLILSNNDFSGGIPVSLCNGAGNFQVVDLSKNHLSGKIPRCIGNLSLSILDFSNWLSVLDLSSNNLHGPIPSSLGFQSRLEYLHLGNNNFHKEFPLSLQNLTCIVTLDLGKNAFTGVIPHWIGELIWPCMHDLKSRPQVFLYIFPLVAIALLYSSIRVVHCKTFL